MTLISSVVALVSAAAFAGGFIAGRRRTTIGDRTLARWEGLHVALPGFIIGSVIAGGLSVLAISYRHQSQVVVSTLPPRDTSAPGGIVSLVVLVAAIGAWIVSGFFAAMVWRDARLGLRRGPRAAS